MKKYREPTPDDYIEIAERVRSGEYFRESRAMYDIMVNDAMTERYFYSFVTILALLTALISFYAMQSLYPLSRSVPFISKTEDMVNDSPRMYKLKQYHEQSTNEALLLYFARVFVQQYEEYDIRTIERNMNGLRTNSSPELFANYQRMMQPSNPDSPVVKFQRHTSRLIQIKSTKILPNSSLEVIFDVTLRSDNSNQLSQHRAVIGYEYSSIDIEAISGKITPPKFVVTSYSSNPI